MRLKEPIFNEKIPSNSGWDDASLRIGRLRWILRTPIFKSGLPKDRNGPP